MGFTWPPKTPWDTTDFKTSEDNWKVAVEGNVPRAAAIARSNRVVAIGDSLTAGGTDESLGRYGGYTTPFSYASLTSKARIRHVKNAGIASQSSTQIAARFATDVVANTPGAVIILCGTNDSANTDMATTRANIAAMVDQALAAGILPCLMTLPPQNLADTTQRTNLRKLNYWIVSYAAKLGIPGVDAYSVVVDASNGNYKSGLNTDNIHWNEAGARVVGQALRDVLEPLLPNNPLPLHGSAADYGNLIMNGCFIGDSDANGWANSWSFAGGANTPTPSLVAGSGSVVGNWQKISTATSGGMTATSTAVNVGSGYAVGDKLLFCGLMKTVNCVANGTRVFGELYCVGAASPDRVPIYNPILDTDYSAFAQEMIVPSGTTSISARIVQYGGTASQAQEVWFAQMTLINLTALGLG